MLTQLSIQRRPSSPRLSISRKPISRKDRDRETAFAAAMHVIMARTKGRPAIRDLMDIAEWESELVPLSASAEVLVRCHETR